MSTDIIKTIAASITDPQERSSLVDHQWPLIHSAHDVACRRLYKRGLLGIGHRGGYAPTALGRAVAGVHRETDA